MSFSEIHDLFEDEWVTEIIINAFDQVAYEKSGRIAFPLCSFASDWDYEKFIKTMLDEAEYKIDLENPFASFAWRSFRVHMVHPPLNPRGFSLCLRRLRKQRPLTLEDLEQKHWCESQSLACLKQGLRQKKNILIVGPTGSGKTTVLSAMLKTLPENERVVILEDTDEISVPNIASTKLLTRMASAALCEVSLTDLVKESLRMRPDRLVVGEIRGAEAKDLLMALATGHRGSFGTLHASSAREALLRLEMLIQMGAPEWSLDSIRRLIQLTVDWIVIVEHKHERRTLNGIYQISSLEPSGFLVDPVMESNIN